MKVDLYEVFLSNILYFIIFNIMTILTPFFARFVASLTPRGNYFRNYCPQVFESEEEKDSDG